MTIQAISFFANFKRPQSSPTSIHSFTLAVILPTLYCQQYADFSPLFVLVKLMLVFRVHLSIQLIRYAVKIIKYKDFRKNTILG